MPSPQLLSTPELARALRLSVRSVQRYVKAGVIEPDFTTPGGHHRWDLDRVREQLRRARPRDD